MSEIIQMTRIKKRSRTSPLWNYFTVTNKEHYSAVCNVCNARLSYKTTITNLKKHLYKKHMKVLNSNDSVEVIRNSITTEGTDDINEEIVCGDILGEVNEIEHNYFQIGIDGKKRRLQNDHKNDTVENCSNIEQSELGETEEHFEIVDDEGTTIHIPPSLRKRNIEIVHQPKSSDSVVNRTPPAAATGPYGDEFDLFGKLIATQLRQMPKRVAIATQLKLQTVMTEELLRCEEIQD